MITRLYPALCSYALAVFLAVAFAATPSTSRAQAAGEPVAVPGSRVSLVPPEEFYLSDLFSGFFHDATTSSIVVTEIPPEGYAQVDKVFKPGLQANGMSFEVRDEVVVDGRPGFSIRGTQELHGITWNKWILVFSAEDFTGMVTVSSPQAAAMPDDMALAVLRSTKILSSEGYDPRSDLSYVFQETEGFELHSVMQGNTASLISNNGEKVLYAITASTEAACDALSGQEALFSEQALRSVETVETTSIKDPREISVDSLSGLEQLADAVDKKTKEELALYQAVLFEGCRYYRFVGIAPRRAAERYLVDFRRMTESFARKP